MALATVGALVGTFGSLFMLGTVFPVMIAYFISGAIGLPFIVLVWRLDSRYNDLLFRDDIE